MLDFDKLLVDHEGDTVCGDNLEYDSLLLEVRKAIEGKPDQQMGDDVIEGIEPDWKKVKKNCLKLCGQTHSLEVVISLTQAVMSLEGYSGLSDGSKLLEGLIEKYWGCFHPQIDPDDNDPTERLNMLALFEDSKFLLSLQKIELISSKGVGSVSLYDIRKSKTKNDDDESDNVKDSKLLDAVFKSCSNEEKEKVYSDLVKCASSFENISGLLQNEENVGSSIAPSFDELLEILNESKTVIEAHLDKSAENASVGDVDMSDTQVNNSSEKPSISTSSSGINSREDVISAIQKIEDYYYKYEPGSPIPMLLQRAKSLVNKDFIGLMEELSPDSLNQLGLILGKVQSDDM